MSLTASASEWTQVRFPSHLSSQAVDTQLANLTHAQWRSRLNLDLSQTTSVDITALLRILAFINDRGDEDRETIVSAPLSLEVRRCLEQWDFPVTAAMVCRSPFRQLIWEESPHATGDRTRADLGRAPNWHEDRHGKVFDDRLSGFMTYVFETDIQASSVIDTEWARWRTPLLLSMFDAQFGVQGLEIARVVIYELLANAVQHSHANLVVVAARASDLAGRRQDRRSQAKELTVSVWDNGDSVTETLRRHIGCSEPVRGDALVPNDTFLVEPVGWTTQVDRYRAGWKPGWGAPDEELLISSVVPSGAPRSNRPSRQQASAKGVTRPRQGYGLHALYRCVVDLFKGTLEMRSGSHIMTLDVAPRQNKRRFYRMRLQRLDGRPFRGNMLTVRIPLAHGH